MAAAALGDFQDRVISNQLIKVNSFKKSVSAARFLQS